MARPERFELEGFCGREVDLREAKGDRETAAEIPSVSEANHEGSFLFGGTAAPSRQEEKTAVMC